MENTTLHLYKQNFKFSAAHFLIFDDKRAEKLHGHNYQVRVDLQFHNSKKFEKSGYLVDFNELKSIIKTQLDRWDEMVILPKLNPEMKFKEIAKTLEVQFRDRFYAFPKNEVLLLPITNSSVEQLSKLLAELLFEQLKKVQVSRIQVKVEETRGQGASFKIG